MVFHDVTPCTSAEFTDVSKERTASIFRAVILIIRKVWILFQMSQTPCATWKLNSVNHLLGCTSVKVSAERPASIFMFEE
jgi:hypothetical protein